MMKLSDIKLDLDLINSIDWEMTPEDAVKLYLEWGNSRGERSHIVVRGKQDASTYFVVNNWGPQPKIFLIRRNSEEARELAEIEMPQDLEREFLNEIGNNRGLYSIEGNVCTWLKRELLEE
ncbi:MAG: hypothetical protein CSA22_05415 [Deltaproteobacteria bacterium]|nr:MAG: hypothetical protein CSA22_05415 [Deltaproteobacteria bacterium]